MLCDFTCLGVAPSPCVAVCVLEFMAHTVSRVEHQLHQGCTKLWEDMDNDVDKEYIPLQKMLLLTPSALVP